MNRRDSFGNEQPRFTWCTFAPRRLAAVRCMGSCDVERQAVFGVFSKNGGLTESGRPCGTWTPLARERCSVGRFGHHDPAQSKIVTDRPADRSVSYRSEFGCPLLISGNPKRVRFQVRNFVSLDSSGVAVSFVFHARLGRVQASFRRRSTWKAGRQTRFKHFQRGKSSVWRARDAREIGWRGRPARLR